MKIRKTENHHMLLLPVLLILAAAFLATSLTGAFTSEGNDLTGAVVNGLANNRCAWIGIADTMNQNLTVVCPSSKPTVISGGCDVWDSQGTLTGSSRYTGWNNGTQENGWTCKANQQVQSIKTTAYCCNV